MKKILLFALIFMVTGVLFAAQDVTIHKGGESTFGAAYVSTTTATMLISSATSTTTDWLLKNYGPYDVWLDTYVAISTYGVIGGRKESYRLEAGETLSPEGIR